MDFVRTVVFLVCLFWTVDADLDTKVCQPVMYNHGYFPPDPPFSFIIKYRSINLRRNETIHEEIHFDTIKQRQLEITTRNGITSRKIKDFVQNSHISMKGAYLDPDSPNSSCVIGELEDGDRWSISIGLKLLKYGMESFRQEINNTETIRGIKVKFFNGCNHQTMYSIEETTNVTYAWTLESDDFLGAFGRKQPHFSSFVGTINNGKTPVDIKNEIYWYEEDPTFRDEDFSIPPGYFCESGFNDLPPSFPKIPKQSNYAKSEAIESFYENGTLKQTMTSYKVWTSYQLNLIKATYSRNDCSHGGVFCERKYELLEDMNSGIAYIADVTRRTCKVLPLSTLKGTREEITERDGIYKILGPNSIYKKYKWNFKVKETYRNIPIDLWISNAFQSKVHGRPAINSNEIAFLNKDWKEYTDKKLPRNLPIWTKIHSIFTDGKLPKIMTLTNNIYDVIEGEPSARYFRVGNCFYNVRKSQFIFTMKATGPIDQAIVQGSIGTFQYSIAKFLGLDIMRVYITYAFLIRKICTMSVSIYESPHVKGRTALKSMNITSAMAVKLLKTAINKKRLKIDLKSPTEFSKPIVLTAIPNSFHLRH